MILSDWDIKVYLEKNLLVIKPLFEDTVRENGVDLRFGYQFCRFKGGNTVVDTRIMNIPDVLECVNVNREIGFIVRPYEHVLATTLEWVELPHDLVGLVNLRSSFARAGIYIPPCLHPDSWVLGDGGTPMPAGEAKMVYDPITQTWSGRRVSLKYRGEMVEVYIDDIPEIVTPNHRYMAFDEMSDPPYLEKPAMLLEPGDLVAVIRQPTVVERGSEKFLLPPSSARVRIGEELVDRINCLARENGVPLGDLIERLRIGEGPSDHSISPSNAIEFKDLQILLEALGIPVIDEIEHISIIADGESYSAKNFTHRVEDVARFVGYYVGGGAPLGETVYPTVFGEDYELVLNYAELAKKLFGVKYFVVRHNNRTAAQFKRVLGDWLVNHFSEGVAIDFQARKAPKVIVSSSNRAVAEFLAGLYDARGRSDAEDIVLSTTSRVLAIQVKLLLLRLGIYASVDVNSRSEYTQGQIYTVRAYGASSIRALRSWVEYSTGTLSLYSEGADLIPLSYTARRALAELPRGAGEVESKLTSCAHSGKIPVSDVPLAVSKLREHKPTGFLKAIADILWTSKFRWVKVKRVNRVPYEGEVIDWETPSGWHVTYGTITHNTVIDAGFKGNITIELIGGPQPVKVYPEQRFLHVVFLRTSSPVYRPYTGKYQGQVSVTPPKPD